MRGVYEQHWQEALAGARIEPSAALWDSIATKLDTERGRSGWVTLLLVAATVSIAFALPLTIGNSAFEARPDAQRYLSRKTAEEPAIIGEPHEVTSSARSSAGKAPVAVAPAIKPVVEAQALPAVEGTKRTAPVNQDMPARAWAANGYDLKDIDLGVEYSPVSLDDYYLIPFYLPAGQARRGLLASANVGTGSLNNGGSFTAFPGLEKADLAYAPTSGDGNLSVVADSRYENPGSTYYVGGGIALPVGKRWSLLTGIGFLSQRATGFSNLVFDVGKGYQPLGAYDPVVTGAVLLNEPYSYTVTNNYLNVPVTLKYPFIDKRVKFRAGIGLSADIMLAHIVSAEGFGTSNYKPSSLGYTPVVLAGLFNFDVSYGLTEHYTLALETGWRRGFTAIDETRTYYPSSLTMGLVLFYQIR